MEQAKLVALRRVINENLRIQKGGPEPIPYIDVGSVLGDVAARQNHVVFGRRGCGKTLLLEYSAIHLPEQIQPIYLNCEDFKKHSYPNVLIEILDALFGELETHLTGWFGKKKRSRELIRAIRAQLGELMGRDDAQEREVRERAAGETAEGVKVGLTGEWAQAALDFNAKTKQEMEVRYQTNVDKVRQLDSLLPELKHQVREFFAISSTVKNIFLQIDDLYLLKRADQPLVVDYIHRLCKDLPLYFKIATLRHASTLYMDREGQPLGAQERHDYQPINVDFTFNDFQRTFGQNQRIFQEFGRLAGIPPEEVNGLFKGKGFERLVLAGGGVPRDSLSLFLEVLERVQPPSGDGRIGKDDVRILSRTNFERRIEELKQDSQGEDQGILIRGIYVLRQFCLDRKINVVLVSESVLQQNSRIRGLLYRLLDYRIIHSAGTALTHKSQSGTYQAFVIDIGCYAHMRVLDGRFIEIDVTDPDAKERMRSAPILEAEAFDALWAAAPADAEAGLAAQG